MSDKNSGKIFTWILVGAIAIFIVGWFLVSKISPAKPGEIISEQGIHWHANLTIKILGEEQEIPADIGIGVTHQPLHTHETDGVIHMEFSGLVKKDDIKLGRFLQIWGKKFPEGKRSMLVNGQLNSEFESYIMKDGDKIEIIFE